MVDVGAAAAAALLGRSVPEGEVPRELLELPLQVVLRPPLPLSEETRKGSLEPSTKTYSTPDSEKS